VFDAVVTHCPFAQQPLHIVPPHVQDPPLQVWPIAQTPHAVPLAPHAVPDCADEATQVSFASQHPFEHEEGVQVHVPDAPHAWPLAQPWQAAPPAPHAVIDWLAYATQLPFESQHPSGHDAASQVHVPDALHSCPCAHATHAPPLAPHAVLVGVTHCPVALQQPVAQAVPSHPHAPPLHV
jgi:hypothetical protein